jgi:hypothetical protein
LATLPGIGTNRVSRKEYDSEWQLSLAVVPIQSQQYAFPNVQLSWAKLRVLVSLGWRIFTCGRNRPDAPRPTFLPQMK